jgi:hypothetical protein
MGMISNIETAMIQAQAQAMQQSIDQMIIDELYDYILPTYYIHKSWTDSQGRSMHRISVSGRVLEWLETAQSQYGIKNPQWWLYQDQVNISDRLLSMLILKWGLGDEL